jgi:hypothetical protein
VRLAIAAAYRIARAARHAAFGARAFKHRSAVNHKSLEGPGGNALGVRGQHLSWE